MFRSFSGARDVGDAVADRVKNHIRVVAAAGFFVAVDELVLLREHAPGVEPPLRIVLATVDVPRRPAEVLWQQRLRPLDRLRRGELRSRGVAIMRTECTI